jgi:DNA segregation ATPase FtsK/SpoIIIE, S-DNA-T family
MSKYQMSQSPILPGAITAELGRLPWRILGLVITLAAAAGWASLLTWSIQDPSLNHAAKGAPSNLLGSFGATLADVLFQGFGLASIALFLPLVFWGVNFFNLEWPENAKSRFALWPLSTAVLASGLGALPLRGSWPLPNGLGGVAGDILSSPFIRIGGLLEPTLAHIIGGLGALALGFWLLVRACGLHVAEVAPPLRLPSSLKREEASKNPKKREKKELSVATANAETTAMEGFGAIIVRYTRRWRERFMALIVPVKPLEPAKPGGYVGPREYWMTDAPLAETPDDASKKPTVGKKAASSEKSASSAQKPADGAASPEAASANRVEPHFGPGGQPQTAETGAAAFGTWHEPVAAPGGNVAVAVKPQTQAAQATQPAAGAPPFRIIHGGIQGKPETAAAATSKPAATRPAPPPPPPAKDGSFTLPPLSLLRAPQVEQRLKSELSEDALAQKAELLLGVLGDFGVKGRIIDVHPGPVITLYVLEPARGTKSSRVIGLADDVARSMSAVSARVAVIPGRDAIGIELPNLSRETVYLRELLDGEAYRASPAKLALALGKTIGGEPVITDLARMPHLLIAGTTGSGKSVGINTMILSLLYRLTPDQCRFIMIDPKMLELSVYDGIPHLLTPVVTDPRKAITALKWTVNEMNVRYERMCKVGVRNIQGYNQKVLAAKKIGAPLIRTVQTGFDEASGAAIYEHEDVSYDPMAHIVVVIDEMADLMLVAGKEIEYAVQRLSQMARAAGIHLIMATQRPSVDVITGTIKANFPSRISFQVTSKIDSRTILGEQGAEQLLGAGDMLFMAAGGRIMRAHGPFVGDDEVEKVVNFLKAQGEPQYLADVLISTDDDDDDDDNEREPSGDDLYDQAVDIVLTDRKPTTSYLQRRLGVGYNRAASLIERMEEEGLLSAPNRTGKREILVGEPAE